MLESLMDSNSNKLNLDFIAGLIDADGSLQLGMGRKTGYKLRYNPEVILDITNKDLTILQLVKDTLGFGVIFPSRNCYTYRVKAQRDAGKIIDLFETRFHGSAEKEIPLWKEGLSLVSKKETRSLSGLSKYVHLMYAINSKGSQRDKPIDYWFNEFGCEYQPEYVEKINASYAALKKALSSVNQSITGDYVSSYFQGDGSFNLSNGKRFQPNFTCTDADRDILVQIQEYLRCSENSVFSFNPKSSERNNMCARLQITRFKPCRELIIPHFDKFPVYGMQRRRYHLWRKAVMLQQVKSRHLNYKNEIDGICKQLSALKEM